MSAHEDLRHEIGIALSSYRAIAQAYPPEWAVPHAMDSVFRLTSAYGTLPWQTPLRNA